ncbi:YadA family autotransporter adhesin, partial [Xanthomonas sacchari]|uniref:YadA family autotransporter adhesin n=1 Tax=Xanthomonas sacchari TaxID=56458 RepID=UPI00225E508E
AQNDDATAVGPAAFAGGVGSTALGNRSWAGGTRSLALGGGTVWNGNFFLDTPVLFYDSIAIGTKSDVFGDQSIAIGPGARVGNSQFVNDKQTITNNSVALGAGSVAERDNTVSIGAAGAERQLTNLAAGTMDTDAVNLAQLRNVAAAFGAGSVVDANGNLIGGNYLVQGTHYTDLGSAMGALDTALTGFGNRLNTIGGSGGISVGGGDGAASAPSTGAGTNAVAVGSGATANGNNGLAMGAQALAYGPNDTAIGGNATVNADGSTAVGANSHIAAVATNSVAMGEGASVSAASGTALGQGASATAQGAVALGQGSVADRAQTVSIGSAGNERQLANVAAGTQATDAVNKSQLDNGVATAKSYTDARFGTMADSFEVLRGDVDARLRDQDRRIDRQGAMSAAMLNMATSAAGIRTQNRVGAGIGFQNGESALSVGYQRAFSDRATVTIGGAFSSDDSSIGIGAGFGW